MSPPDPAYGDRVPSRTQAPETRDAGPPSLRPQNGRPQPGLPQPRPNRPRRTLWEEGRKPGRLVVQGAVLALLVPTLSSLLFGNRIGIFFDVTFVLVCLAAALLVRPQDFFTVGVLPPLLLGLMVTALATVDRAAVARADDPLIQAVVSGLAHHALALVIGYALTLAILALRQVALRNNGTLRPRGHPPR